MSTAVEGPRYLDIYARGMSCPDALSAVAHHVDHEYGITGYRIGQVSDHHFVVRHSDGSTFVLRYGIDGGVSRMTREAMEALWGADVYGG